MGTIKTAGEINSIFAKYMGAKELNNGTFDYLGNNPDTQFFQFWDISHLKYDTSWDWIMPVVAKVNETGISGGIKEDINTALLSLDLETLNIALLEFIEWFNNRKN